jgi:hypothetical protein
MVKISSILKNESGAMLAKVSQPPKSKGGKSMFKKFLSLTLALVMALGLVAGAVDYKDADDISDYAEKAVQTVHDLNIMQGDNHGNFNPKEPITREQMFRVMYAVHNAGDINVNPIYASLLTSSYKDADQVATWARAFAGYNVSKQIFKGDGAGMLRPKASISYQEVAVLFLRALGYKDDYITGYNPLFSWGQNALLLAHEAGITKGLPSISNPAAAATREDVAVMATNALGAKTVSYDKENDAYDIEDSLLKVKYGIGDEDDYIVSGIVNGTQKNGNKVTHYTLLGSDTQYELKDGETFDADLIGKTIRWSYRNTQVNNRINNLAVVADDKLFEDVRLDKLSGKVKDDDVILTIDGTEVKIAISKFGIYYAGNGALTLKEEDSILGDGGVAADKLAEFLAAFPFKDAKTVDIAINDGKLIIRGWLTDSYSVGELNLPTYGFGKVVKVSGDYVVIDVKSWTKGLSGTKLVYIADELNGAAKGDRVLFEVNYADALLGKNNDAKEGAKDLGDKIYSGADLLANATIVEVLEPIAVKGDKIVKLSNGTYRMDGKEVAPAAMAAVGFDIDDYDAISKDDTNNPVVFMSDKYIYDGADATPQSDDDTVEYFYGLFVEQYFVPSGDNAGAYIKVLGTDGDTHTLKVAKIWKANLGVADDKAVIVPKVGEGDGDVKGEFVKVTRTNSPVGFDAVGAPVFGIEQLLVDGEYDAEDYEGNLISFSRNDDGTYNVIVVAEKDAMVEDSDKLDFNVLGGLTIKKGSTATGRTVGTGLYYNANTVFFVRYDDKVAVVKGSEIVADQVITVGRYVASTAGILPTVTVAVIEVESLTMVTPETPSSTTTIILTADAAWTTYSDRYEFVLKGIVKGEVKELELTVKRNNTTAFDNLKDLKAFGAVEIEVEDDAVKTATVKTVAQVLGDSAIVDKEVEGYEDGIIKVADTPAKDVADDAKIFFFELKDSKYKLLDSGNPTKEGETWKVYIGFKDNDDSKVATTLIFVKQG